MELFCKKTKGSYETQWGNINGAYFFLFIYLFTFGFHQNILTEKITVKKIVLAFYFSLT